MRKPIAVKLDTVTNLSETLYSNIVYGDTLQIKFTIFENGVSFNLTGQTIILIIKKANGHGIERNITGITSNTFTVNLDEQATCVYEDVEGFCEVRVAGAEIGCYVVYCSRDVCSNQYADERENDEILF